MNGLVRNILKVLQGNQHLEEMNKMKDNINANMEKTIKRLGEESNAGKRSILEMQQMYQMKKGNIWCYVHTFGFHFHI